MSGTRTLLSIVAALGLTGCGAVLHGTRQNVDLISTPAGAKVQVSPGTETYTTPATLNLERKNSYVLTFTSPGYNPATYDLHNGVGTGTVIADVLLTGLVGVLVDGLTGAWYGLNPESANVTLTRATPGGSGPEEIHIQLREADGKGRVEMKSDAPGVAVRVDVKR